jgi:hypothetical protein
MHLGPKHINEKILNVYYSKTNARGGWMCGNMSSIPATWEVEVGESSGSEDFPRQKQALFEHWGVAQVVKLD